MSSPRIIEKSRPARYFVSKIFHRQTLFLYSNLNIYLFIQIILFLHYVYLNVYDKTLTLIIKTDSRRDKAVTEKKFKNKKH